MKKAITCLLHSTLSVLTIISIIACDLISFGDSKGDTYTEVLDDGTIVTIQSPVPVTIQKTDVEAPEGSIVDPILINGTLDGGQKALITFKAEIGFSENNTIAYSNDPADDWTVVPSTLDSAGDEISTYVDHFSIWGVIDEESPPTINAIIADHSAVQEFESIPDYWLDEAKKLTVHFGHTSHGSQIIAGLYYLETYVDPVKYSVVVGPRNNERIPDLPPEENPPALRIWEEGLWPDTADGHLGYWLGEDALTGTEDVLESGLFEVSGWSWCGQVALNDWPYIQQYINAMTYLEESFPDVDFFYMTGHRVSPSEPGNNYQRLMSNNEGIRAYCIANDKILFDFADIEAWDLDGNYHENEDGSCVWCEDWLDANPDVYPNLPPRAESGCGVICDSCAHTHGLNCVIKAKAFWWMLAKIAGWPGT